MLGAKPERIATYRFLSSLSSLVKLAGITLTACPWINSIQRVFWYTFIALIESKVTTADSKPPSVLITILSIFPAALKWASRSDLCIKRGIFRTIICLSTSGHEMDFGMNSLKFESGRSVISFFNKVSKPDLSLNSITM